MSADQGSSKVLTPTMSEAAPKELDALDVLDGFEGVTALESVPSPAECPAAEPFPAAEAPAQAVIHIYEPTRL
ncbi:hypothetical protein ACWGKX_16070, partial [Streptomyces tricolor]